MAQKTTGSARALRVCCLLLFLAMRVRIKLNGSDGGGMLVIQDGWGLPEFIQAGTLELLAKGLARCEKCQAVAGSIMAALSKSKRAFAAGPSGAEPMDTGS